MVSTGGAGRASTLFRVEGRCALTAIGRLVGFGGCGPNLSIVVSSAGDTSVARARGGRRRKTLAGAQEEAAPAAERREPAASEKATENTAA